jgi:hypothetical protein
MAHLPFARAATALTVGLAFFAIHDADRLRDGRRPQVDTGQATARPSVDAAGVQAARPMPAAPAAAGQARGPQ